MHAILIFDPAIQVDSESFERGINESAKFVEWERIDQVPRAIQDLYPLVNNTKIMLGTVWPLKHVAFPDFTAPETREWWKNEILRFHEKVTSCFLTLSTFCHLGYASCGYVSSLSLPMSFNVEKL
uniref:Glycoside hydrolase family 31 TIM barrel domain-containing protein n=1 Tax=Parascaris equorum TaxID=6256 RepID=A0A914S6Z3_PAREQ